MEEDPPEGYDNPREYQQNEILINLLTLISALLLTTFLFSDLVQSVFSIIATLSASSVLSAVMSYEPTIHFPVTVLTILVATFVHEKIHAVVALLLGHTPEIYWKETLVICPNQYIPKNSKALFLILPLFTVNFIGLLFFLPVGLSFAGFVGKVVLIWNTSASMADVYNTIRILNLPKGTIIGDMKTDDGVDTHYCPPNMG